MLSKKSENKIPDITDIAILLLLMLKWMRLKTKYVTLLTSLTAVESKYLMLVI